MPNESVPNPQSSQEKLSRSFFNSRFKLMLVGALSVGLIAVVVILIFLISNTLKSEDDSDRELTFVDQESQEINDLTALNGDGVSPVSSLASYSREISTVEHPSVDFTKVWFDDAIHNTYSLAWGDMDGDGDLDLAVGNSGGYPDGAVNQIYRNDGRGGFTEIPGVFGTDAKFTRSLAWGDMDGDGDLDLAIGNAGIGTGEGQANQIYRNNGGGNFSEIPSALGSDSKWTSSLAWGDMDGDGDLDLAVGNLANVTQIYRNDGGGNFSEIPSALGSDSKWTSSLAWGDMDGDGDLDLAVGNSGKYGFNQIYRNDGGGNFSEIRGALGPGTKSTDSLAWGDMDGDGDLDLAVGNLEDVNQIYRNDGRGNFSEVLGILGSDTKLTWSLDWGDMDGDGDLDLAVGNAQDVNQVYRNDGGDNFFEIPGALGSDTKDTFSLVWGDMDSDGDLDLAVGNHGVNGINQIYRNDGRGNFSEIFRILGTNARNFAWGDIDGDGDLDLAVGNLQDVNRIHRNNGEGSFSEIPGALGSIPYSTHSFAWGDMDGDGDLDLAVGNTEQVNQIYRNDGGGNFFEILGALGSDVKNTLCLAWGDMDGDGDLDLAIGNLDNNQVYRNDGRGNFSEIPSALSTGIESTWSLAWGDIDDDGDLDLAVGNLGDVNQIYRNDGGGNFSEIPGALGLDARRTLSLAWGDVNGDGNLDLVVGNDGVNQIYRNNGGGNFSEIPGALGVDANPTRSLALGDMDGDGNLDIAVGNFEDVSQIYRNDGRGNFSEIPGTLGANTRYTSSLAWGDMDGDGDLDLVVSGGIVFNNTMQGGRALSNNPLSISSGRPYTSTANFYAHEQILDSRVIPITYTLFDPEGDAVGRVEAKYSFNGGGKWFTATATTETVTQSLSLSNALAFDGVNDYIATTLSIDQSSVSPGYTMMAWVYPTITNTGRQQIISTGSSGYDWSVLYDNGEWNVFTGETRHSTGFTVDLNQWQHIAAVFEPDVGVRFYKNGQEALISHIDYGTDDNDVAIGYNPSSYSEHFFGRIDEVQIWQGVRTQKEIHNNRYLKPNGDEAGLIGYWGFDQWDENLAFDKTANANHGQLGGGVETQKPKWVGGPFATYVYNWDTFASGFFGQSDNVVFRMVAYPQPSTPALTGIYKYYNTMPGPFQRSYASATTFPFRVRGRQAQVFSGTITTPIANAIVLRSPVDQTPEKYQTIADPTGKPYRTDQHGYLQSRGELYTDDKLVALLPVIITDTYTLYYASAPPTKEGIAGTPVEEDLGVQKLIVSPENPFMLFNLDVSLEWDARNDPAYLSNLEQDLRRASEILYDLSDGQAALGDVQIHQAKEGWNDADIVIYASNSIRPNANLGGIVTQGITETATSPPTANAYIPGQIRIGATWNRFGNTNGTLGEDWPRVLAHEMGHYMFYLLDNYLGRDKSTGVLIETDCQGSAMTDPYAYSEFLGDGAEAWDNPKLGCEDTLANTTTGRSDWGTIKTYFTNIDPIHLTK